MTPAPPRSISEEGDPTPAAGSFLHPISQCVPGRRHPPLNSCQHEAQARQHPPPRLGLRNAPPERAGLPPRCTHSPRPTDQSAGGAPGRPSPLAPPQCGWLAPTGCGVVVGGGWLRDLHRAAPGAENAPREGHDIRRLGEGAPSAAFRGEDEGSAMGEGRGRFSEIGNRSAPRSPPTLLRSDPRISVPVQIPGGAPPPDRSPAAALSPAYLQPQVHARRPQPRVPRRAGERGRPPGSLPPARLSPPPAASAAAAAAAGALCCNASAAAAAEPARAPVAPVTATPPGAAARILPPAPSPLRPAPGAAPPAQPRHERAAEAGGGGCVAAAVTRSEPNRAARPGTRVAGGGKEGGHPAPRERGGGAFAEPVASDPLLGPSPTEV